jgi:acyl-CoA synthetase (NDP forming)
MGMSVIDEKQLAALSATFSPQSILVYGASSDPGKIGGRPLRYLKELGFRGALHAINPSRDSVQGVPSFPRAVDVPGTVDLAVIVVPAEAVLAAIQDCIAKGVRSAVVLSSGFSEIGEKGARMQLEMATAAKAAGMRLLGPNCLGFVNGSQGTSVTFSPSRELRWPGLGSIGFVTQSGAFGSHCAAVCSNRGIGLGTWITTGNEADIDVADCIAYLAGDSSIRVIAGYIEGCRDAGKLATAFERARAHGKQVVLLKAGTTEVGAAAVVSHTAVMAGRDELFDAFLRQHGVIRAHDVDELLDIAYVCSAGVRPAGDQAAIISTSGGVAVMMADAAIDGGLKVEELGADVQAQIRAILPFAGTRNPIDTTAQMVNDITVFSKSFEIVVAGSHCDIIVAHISFIGYDTALMDKVHEPLARLRSAHPGKLFILSMLSEPPMRERYEKAGFLVFENPTRAIQAAARCRESARLVAGAKAPVTPMPATEVMLEAGLATENAAKAWLARLGIPVPKQRMAKTAQEASAAAKAIGFPVVLKIVSPDIMHKTEAGGVMIGVMSGDAAAQACDRILASVKRHAPDARIEGILVEQQIVDGVEMIAGIVNDAVLGPFVMFGLGGIYAEVLNDTAFRHAPFGKGEAQAMIRELKSFPMLDGARGRPKADVNALAEVLVRLSQIAAANASGLASLDINPLIVTPDGAYAADAVVVAAPG